LERLREIVAAGKGKLDELIDQDKAVDSDYQKLSAIEQMVRYRRDLLRLLRNFVNFADFYGRKGAAFQAGTLFLDGRSCDLVVNVDSLDKHALLAGLSRAYLAYCDCTRGSEKRSIVAAFTAGDTDNLMVGRNGVFVDNQANDWDATITKLVENPISVGQAFWAPYKRLVRLIEEQVAKRATEKHATSNAIIERTAVSATSVADEPVKPAAPAAPTPLAAAPPPEKGIEIGTVAAIGVAVGGIATFLSSIFATFLGLGMWIPIGLLGLLLAISGPSMLIAWLKLRQRNLGPLLDANGWAVNGRVKLNIPLGSSLTKLAALPAGSTRTLEDPFADKRTPWKRYVVLIIVLGLAVAWAWGRLDVYLPEKVQSHTVLHHPAASASGSMTAPAK
jgi:hypothetical protein